MTGLFIIFGIALAWSLWCSHRHHRIHNRKPDRPLSKHIDKLVR